MLWTTIWTGFIMFQLPNNKYFNPMNYLTANIAVALKTKLLPLVEKRCGLSKEEENNNTLR